MKDHSSGKLVEEAGFVDAFDWAVLRLATYFPASASKARLLFGSVSLLTRDRPKPQTSKGAESYKVGKGKSGKVFFRRTVLKASDAIAWYRRIGANEVITPIPSDPREVEPDKDGIALSTTSFEDDPQWPYLGVPLGTDLFSNAGGPGDPAPFRGPGAPRIHRRFGDNLGFEALTADTSAVEFLKRRLHFDVADYLEYLGGLVLVVPDPILRRVQHFLIPRQSDAEPERLIYRLLPWPDQSVANLKLTVLERRSNLLSRFDTVDVPESGFVTVESVLPFDQTGYTVSHPIHGLIAYQQPLPFIRAVNISFGVAGRRVRVEAPKSESPRSPTEGYELSEFSDEKSVEVGKAREDAVVKVVEAEQRRIRRDAARQYRQTWFDGGQREEAVAFLRERLARARQSVLVADPYFGANQILQFLHAVPRTSIDFAILTSRLAFEGERLEIAEGPNDVPSRATNPMGPAREAQKLASFARSLSTLGTRGMRSFRALVLGGKMPPLHDRFLVIDDEVLFLGNSLNALGDRSSLILAVPDPEPVLAKLQAMMKSAVTFETYSSKRLQTLASLSKSA